MYCAIDHILHIILEQEDDETPMKQNLTPVQGKKKRKMFRQE